jgi:spore coat protein SA
LQVIFAGRLIPEKGVHVLTAAMHLLQQRGESAHARIVGSTGFAAGGRSRYVDRIKKDAPSNVTFEGYRSGPALTELFQQADVCCCPSTWTEPFGLVLVEAMATGLPIVATNVGGIPEILADGGGVLIPPNDVEALADALQALAADKTRRLEIGQEAKRSFTKNFSWSTIREKYRMILDTI